MSFTNQDREYPVGAQFIGAPTIYRPGEGIDRPLADKSAMGTVNRPLMNVDDRMGSCRDKGRMWGRVGAWCLSWRQREPVGTAWSTKVAPQRGQAQGPLIHSTPPLVPTGPWAASTSMDRIPRFGRQHSSGLDLAGGEERSSAFEPCLNLTFTPSSSYNFNISIWRYALQLIAL